MWGVSRLGREDISAGWKWNTVLLYYSRWPNEIIDQIPKCYKMTKKLNIEYFIFHWRPVCEIRRNTAKFLVNKLADALIVRSFYFSFQCLIGILIFIFEKLNFKYSLIFVAKNQYTKTEACWNINCICGRFLLIQNFLFGTRILSDFWILLVWTNIKNRENWNFSLFSSSLLPLKTDRVELFMAAAACAIDQNFFFWCKKLL